MYIQTYSWSPLAGFLVFGQGPVVCGLEGAVLTHVRGQASVQDYIMYTFTRTRSGLCTGLYNVHMHAYEVGPLYMIL